MVARRESLASLAKGQLSLQDFEWEPHMRPSPSSSLPSPPQVAIPEIDLQVLYKYHNDSFNREGLDHDPAATCEYAHLVASVSHAASTIGFFQIYNHGISLSALESLQVYARRFFALPFERKYKAAELVLHPSLGPSGYSSGSPVDSPNKWWSEAVRVASSNKPLILSLAQSISSEEHEQQAFSQVLEECSIGFAKLAKDLTIVLLKGLALEGHKVIDKYIIGGEIPGLRVNHYPPCPQPNTTLGFPPHSDVSILTLVWQDLVGGLQVCVNKEWTTIKPRHDALVVNIGDIFQVWSNDQYRSGLHRVLVNAKESRYSIGYFFYSGLDTHLTPIEELLQKTKQSSKFRSTLLSEHRSYVYSLLYDKGTQGVEYLKY